MENMQPVGFSIRTWFPLDPSWTQNRRSVFLLNEEVEVPKSVDDNVWPVPQAVSVDPMNPEQTPLWASRNKMLDKLKVTPLEKGILACEILVVINQNQLIPDWISYTTVEGETDFFNEHDWFFLGFDVADESLISGLMNCGFSPEEKKSLKKRFSFQLNEHGLFSSLQEAQDFRVYSDKRVSEHAPFLIFGIYARHLSL